MVVTTRGKNKLQANKDGLIECLFQRLALVSCALSKMER